MTSTRKDAPGVAVSNCRLRGGAKIENKADADVLQMGANLVR
jgi:hypothetical protein